MILSRVCRANLRAFLWARTAQKDYLHTDCATHESFSIISKLKAFRGRKAEEPEVSLYVDSGIYENNQSESLSEYSSQNIQLPLSDVQTRIEGILRDEFGENFKDSAETWSILDISNFVVKFKVVQKCHQEFGMTIPNNKLYSMRSVHDLVDYYNSLLPEERQTFESVDRICLPNNLTIN